MLILCHKKISQVDYSTHPDAEKCLTYYITPMTGLLALW